MRDIRARRCLRWVVAGACGALMALSPHAQDPLVLARLMPAQMLAMPGDVDSNVPMTWDLVDGAPTLFGTASWGGIPALLAGPSLDRMRRVETASVVPHPGYGVWIESIVPDEGGTWYGYYHHEVPADLCGRPELSTLRIGSAKSTDRGLTWEDLGTILDAPPGSHACTSSNRFVVGGVGDLSAMLDPDHRDLMLFFSEYSRDPAAQGVSVARLAWADRDEPRGRVMVWQDGVWLPPRRVPAIEADGPDTWAYPHGTPLVPVSKPWHDGDPAADGFWGPSVHWNTYLQRYVMLVNRTKDERFNNEGIYISYSETLEDPRAWSAPRKILNGGGWYPQVVGLEPGTGTDKQAGERARFFMTGRSEHFIEFRQ